MDLQQDEELESIQAIYCKPEEFSRCEAPDGQYVTIRFDTHLGNKKDTQKGGIHAFLPHDYPLSSPKEINVFCDSDSIPMETLHSFRLKVEERTEALKGEPMLLDLLCFLQELFEDYAPISNDFFVEEKSQHTNTEELLPNFESDMNLLSATRKCDIVSDKGSSKSSNHEEQGSQAKTKNRDSIHSSSISKDLDPLITALLHLDHMRSKKNYVKLIQKWTVELGLNGRLVFYGRFIFIILQGPVHQVKEYIVRNKTMIVDVDSKGKPCKERMLSMLCETPSEKHIKFKDFAIVENISSLDDLSKILESYYMMDLFKEHVEPICSVKLKKSSLNK